VKSSMLKRGLGGAAVVVSGLSLMAVVAPSAGATPYGAGHTVVVAGGSDTTESLMGTLLSKYDNKQLPIAAPAGDTVHTYNIGAFPGVSSGTNPITALGDTNGCGDVAWHNINATSGQPAFALASNTLTDRQAPSGSGAGRTELKAEESIVGATGCMDIARSSGAPQGSPGTNGTADSDNFEYYAYALDSVGWATTSLKAPATLTTQQVRDIYDCKITNWADVGGLPGQIQRYVPQPGSGTMDFFIKEVLGKSAGKTYAFPAPGDAGTVAGCLDMKGASGGVAIDNDPNTAGTQLFEENQAQTIQPGDIDKAIFPYSSALWGVQASNFPNPNLDKRNGARMGGLNDTVGSVNASTVAWDTTDLKYKLDVAGVVTENNIKQATGTAPTYPGIRYVYNVLDNKNTLPGYLAARNIVGFDTASTAFAAKSPLCNNDRTGLANRAANPAQWDADGQARSIILSAGFAPLPSNFEPGLPGFQNTQTAGASTPTSTCRLFDPKKI
jgi:ABC-type phosphate transport system substrate-binding protein